VLWRHTVLFSHSSGLTGIKPVITRPHQKIGAAGERASTSKPYSLRWLLSQAGGTDALFPRAGTSTRTQVDPIAVGRGRKGSPRGVRGSRLLRLTAGRRFQSKPHHELRVDPRREAYRATMSPAVSTPRLPVCTSGCPASTNIGSPPSTRKQFDKTDTWDLSLRYVPDGQQDTEVSDHPDNLVHTAPPFIGGKVGSTY